MADATPRLVRARLGVSAAFGVNGLLMGLWIVNIPAIEQATGIAHSTLGLLLLVLGLGAFIGMQATGYLVDRIGSKATTIGAGLAMSAVIVTPGLARGPVALGGGLIALGFANGALDVAMNAHGVAVERAYGRPILSSFHAFFSIGGAVGAFLGAGLKAAKLGPRPILFIALGLGVAIILTTAPMLLPRTALAADGGQVVKQPRRSATRAVWMLGLLAFLLMLCEGVANDWSALQISEHYSAPESTAALGYGFFAVAMTIGRLSADRIVQRVGPTTVVRFGSLGAAVGLVLILTSGALPLTLAGWAVLGLGLSGTVPQVFSAAGNLTAGGQGVNLARVVGCGYIGFLAGPAVIGWVAERFSVTGAMVIPLFLCAGAAVLGSFIVAGRSPDSSS